MPTRPQQHKPYAPRKQGNRQATRALNTGSKAWRWLRTQVLVRDLYKCCECGRIADQVDHRDNNAHNNAMDNLFSMCGPCHSTKTRREQNAEMTGKPVPIRGCDINGTPHAGWQA